MSERFVTWLDGREAVVDLRFDNGSAAVRAVIEVGEERREVTFERIARPHGGYLLLMPDGTAIDGRILRGGCDGEYRLAQGALKVTVKALSERDAWLGNGSAQTDDREVRVAMPGRVVKIVAEVGTVVQQGDPLLVIEAMKMENEVKAERAGVISAVHAREGDPVEAGEVLMELDDER